MYSYLTKSQLLPISKTTNVHHFYEFQGKQLHEKQLQQKKQLEELLTKIQQEEFKEKHKKSQPAKIANFDNKDSVVPQGNNKSYFIDMMSSNHSSKPNQPKSTRSFNDFYEKNKKWKQNLQAQILKKKQQKIQQQQRELSQCRKPLSQQNSKFDSIANNSKNSNTLHHAFQSKGPISGWTQRFHQYINKRLPQCPEVEFKPTINKKSRMIAGRMVGKVEDRLIKFGEIMKMRKHEMIIEEAGKLGRLPRGEGQGHYASTQTNHSDLFFRLYKQGQKTNRRVKQHQERKKFSFQPSISKIPEQLQKKVQQKRQKSPLYTAKKFTKQQTHRLLQLYTNQTGKTYSEAQFQNFMKRNQLLLEKRNKQMEQKVREDMMREERERRECTFVPVLNRRRVGMAGKGQQQQGEEVTNEHVDYEYSRDELLEQSPSQLFTTELKPTPDSKKSTQLKPKSKYLYPHSYTQPSQQFQYQIQTPSKHQLSKNMQMSNTKSPVTHKNEDMSEMDSLEFSGQKLRNVIMKNSKRNGQVGRDQNQVINYELTFSNTKLAQELSEIHHTCEEDHQQKAKHQITINENQTKKHNISSRIQQEFRSQRELSDYNEKKEMLQSSWESQLQKVKNRLQSLMSGEKAKNQPEKQWK